MHEMIAPLFKEVDDKIKELGNQRKADVGLISLRNQLIDKIRIELYKLRDLEIEKWKKRENL